MTMNRVLGVFWWVGLAVFFLVPGAVAQTSMTLTGSTAGQYLRWHLCEPVLCYGRWIDQCAGYLR